MHWPATSSAAVLHDASTAKWLGGIHGCCRHDHWYRRYCTPKPAEPGGHCVEWPPIPPQLKQVLSTNSLDTITVALVSDSATCQAVINSCNGSSDSAHQLSSGYVVNTSCKRR